MRIKLLRGVRFPVLAKDNDGRPGFMAGSEINVPKRMASLLCHVQKAERIGAIDDKANESEIYKVLKSTPRKRVSEVRAEERAVSAASRAEQKAAPKKG